MNEKRSKRRSYSSNLRQQQQEETRKRILEIVAKTIAQNGSFDFSVNDIAREAGVSYASVYRHFPTRDVMLEALYAEGTRIIGSNLTLTSLSPEEISGAIERFVEVLEQDPDMSQVITMAFASIQPEDRRMRDRNFQETILDALPDLDPAFAWRATAIICHLYSTLTWSTLRRRFGLEGTEMNAALTWAIQTLLQDLARRSDGVNGAATGDRAKKEGD